MKNMKVSSKLILSFLIVTILAVAIGAVGITGTLQIADSGVYMYESLTEPMPHLANAEQTLLIIRIHVREMVMASLTGDFAQVEIEFESIVSLLDVFYAHMDTYRALVRNPETMQLFDEARELFDNRLVPVVISIYEASTVGDTPAILAAMELCRYYSDHILANFEQCFSLMVYEAEAASLNATSLAQTILIAIIAVLVVVFCASIFLALYLAGLISKPISKISQWLKHAGTTGDITMTEHDKKDIELIGNAKDEIGELSRYAGEFFTHILNMAQEVETIASGDLTHEFQLLSEQDTMGTSLQNLVNSLNYMFGEINDASAQVTTGSRQIAGSSQSLAQGSTEQAATVQQLSASATEIAEKTKANADMAGEASELALTIKSSAEKGSNQMDAMVSAVDEISQASQSIGKVIKVIDDIAFQTNILALNAAVEAARAGTHGKGFAVVADEVRTLAAKSAEAAKDTGALISNSIDKAQQGASIAQDTAESLVEIVTGINKSNEIIGKIALASEAQTEGISQINSGIGQVDKVVQQNSATAQESAATAQELSAQSDMLKELIARFKTKSSDVKALGQAFAATPAVPALGE